MTLYDEKEWKETSVTLEDSRSKGERPVLTKPIRVSDKTYERLIALKVIIARVECRKITHNEVIGQLITFWESSAR